MIGPENLPHLHNSDSKPKTIVFWSLLFSRAFGSFLDLTLSFYGLYVTLSFLPAGCCDYFGFAITTLNRKAGLLVRIGRKYWSSDDIPRKSLDAEEEQSKTDLTLGVLRGVRTLTFYGLSFWTRTTDLTEKEGLLVV